MPVSRSMTRQDAEAFLYREARLLDSGQLEVWLGLFAADGLYWIPINEQADPEREPSVIYDDATQRAKRVLQLLQGSHYVQVSPSRTVHFISNVEVEDGTTCSEVTLHCNVVVYELRPGDHQALQVGLGRPRAIVGQCGYRLRYEGIHLSRDTLYPQSLTMRA